jgi:hypothetical protein
MPATVPEASLIPDERFAGAEGVPLGQRVGGRVIHFPVVVGRQTPGEPNDWFVLGADDTLRPATGRNPPQDGSGDLIDHHGLKLLTQPRKEPPRALRHPRLVAATTHNYEHPNHHRSQERANPS